jgi:hypothetical protein
MERRCLERHYYEALRRGCKLDIELREGSCINSEPTSISFRDSHYVLVLRNGAQVPVERISKVALN